jgi:short-subunit dehydrogenase
MLFNKTVVLTGASGGIGQALARKLAQGGARLILMGRNRSQLQLLIDELGDDHQL